MYGESNMETYITICKTDSQWEFAVCLRHFSSIYMLLGSKVMTNLDSILKSRDITVPTKVCLVKTMVFPVVRSGCELDYKES